MRRYGNEVSQTDQKAIMKSIAMLALIVSLMLFASCARMPQWAVNRLPQSGPDSHVEMRASIPHPSSEMGEKRTLGTYIQQGSRLLEEGNQDDARLELQRGLYYYPDNEVLVTLFKQIDADPKASLGEKFTYYTIRPGDTLSTIAQDKLGNTLLFYLLAKYNDIEKPRMINVGQHIKIPTFFKPSTPVESRPKIAEAPPAPVPTPKPEPNRTHPFPAPPQELSARQDDPMTRDGVPQIAFGQYHALVIGNNDYRYVPKLEAAVPDAQAISALLQKDYDFDVELLLNATREEVMGSLYNLRGRLSEQDNLLIYYAGHGVRDDKSQEGYWLAVDAHQDNPANWISIDDITTVLRSMASKHIMVVADSCFSGTLTRAVEPTLPNAPERRDQYLMKMLQKRSRTALTSGGLEPVPDRRPGAVHSVFARAFMTALRENPGILEGQKLFDKVRYLVVVDAPNTPEYANIRFTGHEGSDFFFVRQP